MASRTSVDAVDAILEGSANRKSSALGDDSSKDLSSSLLHEAVLGGSSSPPAHVPSEQGGISKFVHKILGLTYHEKVFDFSQDIGPQMWYSHNIALYSHYAAVGLVYAIGGLSYNFCYYYYDGSDNVCANAQSLIFVAWGFKVFFAMISDSFRPFGSRRRFYMILGWIMVCILTALLAVTAATLSVGAWLGISMAVQFFLMLADVPADGYSVEIGQLEKQNERGMVLANGQRIRFAFTVLGGLIQSVLVNGPSTNDSDCDIGVEDCWSWGLNVGQYYTLILVIIVILVIPVLIMREIDSSHIPQHSFSEHSSMLWKTLQNPTTLYLLIFVSGNGMFSMMAAITTTYVQYLLIGLTNFQSGITAIVTYLAVVSGIIIFQKYFIHKNWRVTLYLSACLNACFGLLWILCYHNVWGLLNPWFTIFITMNQYLAQGISQVLFSMAVIELAKPGQEAVTYELIISVANAASSMSTILATQLLTPMEATSCDSNFVDDDVGCESHQVNLYDYDSFKDSNGPTKFTNYQLVILAINIVGMLLFTQFLPRQKDECAKWKLLGESDEFWLKSANIGRISFVIATCIISYQILSLIMFLNPQTACLPAFGGSGC